jgi:hypothetical protein
VSADVELLIFVHLENVRVAIPRPQNFIKTQATWLGIQPSLELTGLTRKNGFWQLPENVDQIDCETQAQDDSTSETADGQTRQEGIGSIEDKEEGAVSATATEAPLAVEAPCKIFPGQHFEYNVTNFAELQRRYFPVDPLYTTHVYSTKNSTAQAVMFFTPLPMLPGVEFAAACGGGLKYRVFQVTDALKNTTAPMAVSLLPYTSNPKQLHFASGFMFGTDAEEQFGQSKQLTAVGKNGNIGTFAAREYLFPQAGCNWIDFKVNAFTQYDYLIVPEDLDSNASIIPATVTASPDLTVVLEVEEDDVPVSFNISAADEFRCGIWRCPVGLELAPYDKPEAVVPQPGEYCIGGWREAFSSPPMANKKN